MSLLKLSEAFLRFLFLSSLLAVTRADPPYNNCSAASNFTVGSTFQHNLDLLLNFLSSNASISRFYSTAMGTGIDEVYGNFLCIGNVSLEICHRDVKSAVDDIKRLCPTSKEAIVWEEYSQIRYSDRPFLGLMDDTGDQPYWNQQNISDPYPFSKIVKEMMGNLSQKAAFDSSRNMLATGESDFTAIEKVYGLVQCTRDLSGNDCNRCLKTALNNIQNCCSFYRGARVLSRSCYLRYELYPFDALGVANPPPPPPPTPWQYAPGVGGGHVEMKLTFSLLHYGNLCRKREEAIPDCCYCSGCCFSCCTGTTLLRDHNLRVITTITGVFLRRSKP